MRTRIARGVWLFTLVSALILALAGAAFAQEDTAQGDMGQGDMTQGEAVEKEAAPQDTGQDGGARTTPDCTSGGAAGEFGRDCQAFIVNESGRPAGWAVLHPGETHVYRFYFSAYRDPGSDDDADEEGGGEDPSVAAERNNVTVLFKSEPLEGATLEFYTRDAFNEGDDPFGAATVGDVSLRGDGDEETDNDATRRLDFATWQGNLSASGTYYAVVSAAGGQSGAVMYNIEVHGGGVRDFTFASDSSTLNGGGE